MALFWGGVHRLEQGDLIRFKIVRVNFAGESPASKPNTRGITVEKQPATMLGPEVVRGAMSFKFNIKWSKLTGDDTGGSAILGYNLQYHPGLGSWEEVVGLVATFKKTSYVQTMTRPAPEKMFYRIRARNRWGWGPFSD